MKRLNVKLLAVSTGVLIVIFLEGLMSLGTAFNFEHYTPFSWFVQGVILLWTICMSLRVVEKECSSPKDKGITKY
jgi:hypothetical protein